MASLTEGSFMPQCLSVASIHSLEPHSPNKYYPGVKTVLVLRKNSRSDETLMLREDYSTVKELIRAARHKGLGTLRELAASNT